MLIGKEAEKSNNSMSTFAVLCSLTFQCVLRILRAIAILLIHFPSSSFFPALFFRLPLKDFLVISTISSFRITCYWRSSVCALVLLLIRLASMVYFFFFFFFYFSLWCHHYIYHNDMTWMNHAHFFLFSFLMIYFHRISIDYIIKWRGAETYSSHCVIINQWAFACEKLFLCNAC